MPSAARVGDKHCCHEAGPVPHVGGEILDGCATVLIGEESAARVGDRAHCSGGAPDVIAAGELTVLIEERPAARLGDATAGGHVTSGLTTVQIGAHPEASQLRAAARDGLPFCEKPVRVRPSGRHG
jgi:uncharacterized Zn-binding protein involved in type VI secretion